MLKNTPEGVLDLLLQLVRIPGVSETPDEAETARFIHSTLAGEKYFEQKPENLFFEPVPEDPWGRGVVAALVEAAEPTAKTVIMTGHYDVVPVDDFGPERELAFSPLEYTRRLTEKELEGEAAEDLASGDYLFGRGVMDMKCGLAAEMTLLAEASEKPEALNANMLFMVVPDEEVNSVGMRAAVPFLIRLREERGLDYRGAVLTEPPNAGAPDAETEVISLGTAGKVMPFFFCVGKGAHVGQYFDGFSAALMSSCCTMKMEANPDFADEVKGETVPPPACLFQRDLRKGYSVTVPDRAAAYFSLLTLDRLPAELMKDIKKAAEHAMADARAHLKSVGENCGGDAKTEAPANEEEVVSFEEFASLAAKVTGGDIKERVRSFVDGLDPSLDDRDRCLAVVSAMLDWSGIQGPMIIVGFMPPYYPHRTNTRKSPGERRALAVAERVIEAASEGFGETLETREHFMGICDLSYMGFQGSAFDVFCMAANTPGWGTIYRMALKEIMALDIPAINVGPRGKDPHRPTERLHMPYSTKVFPQLLAEAVHAFGEEN
ncbi:MAG: M20/M25/M40 family metallo-hydrolase [Synergistota bacterium]|nr:M20/M25/M40 family metallo-hydrolase [Synergistota bacterium]